MFEKIEESRRQCKGVEDLNDDETMELCILSNELNASETTTTLNPSTSDVKTTELSFDEKNTEQPELFA